MKKNRTFNITALASSEQKDLSRLSTQARKGWLLHDIKIPYLSYELQESEGVERDYLIDFNDAVNEDYLNTYKKKGWNYVCSIGNLHYFSAHKNTPTHYTNQAKKAELYQKKSTQFFLVFLVLVGLVFATGYGFLYFSNEPSSSTAVVSVFFASTLLQIIMSVFLAYASFTFYSKANHIRKK